MTPNLQSRTLGVKGSRPAAKQSSHPLPPREADSERPHVKRELGCLTSSDFPLDPILSWSLGQPSDDIVQGHMYRLECRTKVCFKSSIVSFTYEVQGSF